MTTNKGPDLINAVHKRKITIRKGEKPNIGSLPLDNIATLFLSLQEHTIIQIGQFFN